MPRFPNSQYNSNPNQMLQNQGFGRGLGSIGQRGFSNSLQQQQQMMQGMVQQVDGMLGNMFMRLASGLTADAQQHSQQRQQMAQQNQAALQQVKAELQQQIDAIKSGMATKQDVTDAIDAAKAAIKADVGQEVSNQLGQFKADVQRDITSTVDARLAPVEAKVNSLETAMTNMANGLSQFQTDVGNAFGDVRNDISNIQPGTPRKITPMRGRATRKLKEWCEQIYHPGMRVDQFLTAAQLIDSSATWDTDVNPADLNRIFKAYNNLVFPWM